ncbi:MAG TPA: glycosyltransferase [Sedimenticola sp.]|nr:glycosyltransferase [Sedimenticola sp.]
MRQLATEDILGYPVVVANKDSCVKQIISWISNSSQVRNFVCANPHSIQVAQQDKGFQKALLNADMITPDGVGVIIASKILKGCIQERVTGSDIFWGLSKKLSEKQKGSYFFLGSTEEVLDQIREKMAHDFPGIAVVGTYSPPFKSEFSEADNEAMVAAINAVQPDVLWVGMTAPKQEKWIYENKDKLDVKFIGAVGAVFDFFVGRVQRSHPVFQSMGLEWLPRLLQEPRRLWRRNFISNPMFLMRVLKERIASLRS